MWLYHQQPVVSVQDVKAALHCQMFGWVLRMLLSTRVIREYCLAFWRQVPFKRHWMFLLSLKVKKPLIWSAGFFVSFFVVFFPLACQGLGGVSWPGEQQWPLIQRSPSLCHTQGRASSFFLCDFVAYLSASNPLPMGWYILLPLGLVMGPFWYWLFLYQFWYWFFLSFIIILIYFFFLPNTNIHHGLHSWSIFCCFGAVCYCAKVSFLCAKHLYSRTGPRRLRGMSSAWVCCLGLTVSRYGVVNEC